MNAFINPLAPGRCGCNLRSCNLWKKTFIPLWINPMSICWEIHDDVIKWKHFPRYWSIVRGIQRSPVNSHHKGQWCEAFMFSLICTWINGWVKNREASDFRRHRAHYDVIVMALRSMPNITVDEKSTLFQVVAWYPSGNKALHESMVTQIYVAMWRH